MPIGPLSNVSERQVIAVVAILAVAAGALLAPQVYSTVTDADGSVAVVEIDGTITTPMAQDVEEQLRDARTNDSIDAVVLEVESGGGLPAQSERMYAAVDRTAAEMPVIAAVDTLGASGAYLAIAPADEIYVAPSAQAVGSVGVAGTPPTPTVPDEGATGPDKNAADPAEPRERQQVLANLFIENVLEQRGDEIELDREGIAHADAYLGTEAVDNGFADEFGFVDDAIDDAAREAGLDTYEVETHRSESATGGLGIPLVETTDGDVVIAEEAGIGDETLNDALILAVAPQVWAETVGEDVEMWGYTGTDPAAVTNGGEAA